MINCGMIKVLKLFASVTVSQRLKLCSIGLLSVEQYPFLVPALQTPSSILLKKIIIILNGIN